MRFITTVVNTPLLASIALTAFSGMSMSKESAAIAVSLVKALLPERAQMLDEHDLHIHVPDGATPKDGPSAGITLTTALASQLTGVAVPPTVAMTGEISLQGDVNPIGGLPEKLMAAQREGAAQVFIPRDNVDDLKDVAEEVKNALKITPVSTVREVLSALEIPMARKMQGVRGKKQCVRIYDRQTTVLIIGFNWNIFLTTSRFRQIPHCRITPRWTS